MVDLRISSFTFDKKIGFKVQFVRLLFFIHYTMYYSYQLKCLSFVAGMFCLLSSCVYEEYDLSKGINKDITIGADGILLPVGNMEKIRVSKLIGESESIVLEGGLYAYRKKGVMEESRIEIDPVRFSIDRFQVSPIKVDFDIKKPLSFFKPVFFRSQSGLSVNSIENEFMEAVLYTDGKLDINEKIPSEFEIIHEVLAEKGSCVYLNVHLDFPDNFPKEIDSLTLENFEVRFPDFIQLNDPRVKDHVLLLNDGFDPHKGYQTQLEIIGMDFRSFNEGAGFVPVKENGESWLRIESDNKIELAGKIKTQVAGVKASGLKNVIITPIISLNEITVGMVKGYVNPDFETIQQQLPLELEEELDFIKQDALLDLYNPQVYFTVDNTMGVPLDLELKLSTRSEASFGAEYSQLPPIHIRLAPSSENGEPAQSQFLISKQGTERPGYETVRVPELSELFKGLPESVSVQVDAVADQSVAHEIDLSPEADKFISASYEVVMPLHFETLELSYVQRVEGIKKELEKYASKQDRIILEVMADALNTIPVDLNLSVVGRDTDNNVIETIVGETCDIQAGIDGKDAVKTETSLKVVIEKDGLPLLESLDLLIDGYAGGLPEGVLLRENQFVQLTNLRIKLLGGININLDKE